MTDLEALVRAQVRFSLGDITRGALLDVSQAFTLSVREPHEVGKPATVGDGCNALRIGGQPWPVVGSEGTGRCGSFLTLDETIKQVTHLEAEIVSYQANLAAMREQLATTLEREGRLIEAMKEILAIVQRKHFGQTRAHVALNTIDGILREAMR